MWQNFAQFGVNMLTSLAGNSLAQAQAKAYNRVQSSNTQAAAKMRRASNMEAMAKGNLARFTQSLNSNRALDEMGSAVEASVITHLRERDARTQGHVLMDITKAEELGAAVAAQGFNGMGGGVVDMINHTTALRESINKQLSLRETEQVTYDYARQRNSLTHQMFAAPDSSMILDSLDYSVNATMQQAVPSTTSAIVDTMLDSVKNGSAARMVGDVADWLPKAKQTYSLGPARFGDKVAESASPYSMSNTQARFGWALNGASYKL